MSNLPQIVVYGSQRVLTTRQLAEKLGTDENNIHKNYQNNKDHYILGEDYFVLEGEELKQFKLDYPQIFQAVDDKRTPKMYLWTEWGTLLHVKSLNTDEAWVIYKWLRREYYQVKEQLVQQLTHHERSYEADFLAYKLEWRDYICAYLLANGHIQGRYFSIHGYFPGKSTSNKRSVSLLARTQVLTDLLEEQIIEKNDGSISNSSFRLVARTPLEQQQAVKQALMISYQLEDTQRVPLLAGPEE